MDVTNDPPLTAAEQSVAERSATLGSLLAENKYANLLPSMLPHWFIFAPPNVREALRSSMRLGQESQQFVSAVMARITPLEQFAEPLLNAALAAYGWWEVNPKTYGIKEVHLLNNVLIFIANQQFELVDSLIQLILPEVLTPQSLEINLVSSITRHSLLQAAMVNFEALQTEAAGFAPGSKIFAVQGRQRIPQPEFTPEKFAQMCRDLDLGMQYQWHLDRVFSPVENQWPADDPRSKAWQIKMGFSAHLRHEFECALHIAYMKSELSAYHYSLINNLLLNPPGNVAKASQLHSTFEILDFEITGIIIIWPERKPPERTQSCLVYLPQSPYQSFYTFLSFEHFKIQLREWLKVPQFSAYFVQRVPLRHRAEFIRRTDIKHVTWDSLLLRRPPIINEPALLSLSRHRAQTDDPFELAWAQQLAQIKDDARMLMVPTEDEDTRTRLERQAMFLNLGLSLMTLALGFVPVLGEILLATSVIQMGEEVFEGLQAWSHGDRLAALEHLFDIAQNVALTAAGGVAARQLKPMAQVDALVPVKLATGQTRLWFPDISGYELKGISLGNLKPDARGVYSIGDKQLIRLQGKLFEVTPDPLGEHFLLKHPRNPGAFSPRLFHNGSGAWLHEAENPLAWSRTQLLQRLGLDAQGISGEALEQCLAHTQTSEAVLRTMFAEHLPLPPLLLDSVKRIRLNARLDDFIHDMKQGLPGTVEQAQMQLQMLTRLPGWPGNKVLRVVDSAGSTVREYASDLDVLHPRVQIAQSQIARGDLLKVTLECLSSSEAAGLLETPQAWLDTGVPVLAKKIAEQAELHRGELFARLYLDSEPITPDMAPLRRQFPSLPPAVLEDILGHLAAGQRLALTQDGRLPLPVLEEARHYVQALRVNHALEGIAHGAMENADSLAVAWNLLPRLEGWPRNVRLDMRDSTTGRVLQSVGNPAAVYTREIIRTADGYEYHGRSTRDAVRSSNLLDAVFSTLNPNEHSAIGLGKGRPAADFRLKVAALAARERPEVARLLGLHQIKPWFRSPLRLASGRLGYTLGGRSGHIVAERPQMLKDLLLELYPGLNEVQAGQFLVRLKLTPALLTRALVNLKAELQTLRRDLQVWEAANVWSQPRSGARFMLTAQTKRAISQTLVRAWRRLTPSQHIEGRIGYELDLNAWPVDSLPALSADFSHITGLNLANSPNGQFPEAFLAKFSRLQMLTLKNCQLRELPAAIAGMRELVYLNLRDNRIVLNEAASVALSGLTKLKSLNLVGNVLEWRISVRNMPGLEHLLLRYTGLSQWPEGVEALADLRTLDLRDNAIQNIPVQVLTAEHLSLNRVTALHDNPLNADSLRRLEIYNREYGVNLGIDNLRQHAAQRRGIRNWTLFPTYGQRYVWEPLELMEGSADFFRVLEDLRMSAQFLNQHEQLSQRVWRLLNAMHAHTELRERVFEVASNPRTCSDGIAMIFADIELLHLVYTAHTRVNTPASLLELGQGLFRIELLNRHVNSVVKARVQAIKTRQLDYVRQLQELIDQVGVDFTDRPLARMSATEQQGVAYRLGTPQGLSLAELLSPAGVQAQLAQLDPLQVQMFYHVKLADQLGLPARPSSMRFERIAQVTPEDLAVAKQAVLAGETPEALSSAIEKMDFWQEFLYKKYPEAFSRSDMDQDDRMGTLFAAREAMSSDDYVSQSNALGRSREQSRAALVRRLTQVEIAENPQAFLQAGEQDRGDV